MEFLQYLENIEWAVSLFAVLYNLLTLLTVFWILMEKRSPARTIAWILALVFLPGIGLLGYILFGRNLRRRGRVRAKQKMDHKFLAENSPGNAGQRKLIERIKPAQRPLVKLLRSNLAGPLSADNDVQILKNGTEKFPILFKDLRKARRHIHLEYYILTGDRVGQELADILIERAQAGVEIRLIYDAVGSWSLSKSYLERLRAAGVIIFAFMPVFSIYFADRANYRQHRKIVVIDAGIGYVGGLNIADNYLYGDPELGHWRDTHLRIEGQAVHQLQRIFINDWRFVSKEKLSFNKYCSNPARRRRGQTLVQILASGPDSKWAGIQQAYFASINSARQYVYISTPYFLPDEAILSALTTAALSGVDVRILLPAHSDSWLVYLSSLSYVDDLMEAGVQVYLYYGGFNHNKTVVIDDQFGSVGTANMDHRSFDQNFEVNALLFSKAEARKLRRQFEDDLLESRVYTRSSHRSIEGFLQALARLLSPLL